MALPVGLFLAGWLRPPWAVLGVVTLLLGIVSWARRLRATGGAADGWAGQSPSGRWRARFSWWRCVVALLGPGGFGTQTWDWAKHNAILKDLVDQPWPVGYATGGTTRS